MENESVTIPLDYLISTHVLLNSAYERLKAVLGEEAAMTFFALASDGAAAEGIGGQPTMEELKSSMKDYGYTFEVSKNRGAMEVRLYCPHAGKIHPNLGANASFCPMSQVVLGAIRKDHTKSIVTKSELKADGSHFSIKLQD